VKLGIGVLPDKIRWIHVIGLGFLGGMGFTMSLFISNLAFSSAMFLDPAKIGILTGSLMAGILGYVILNVTLKKEKENG
jgi:NhaA family Na+:H+ antiporter